MSSKGISCHVKFLTRSFLLFFLTVAVAFGLDFQTIAEAQGILKVHIFDVETLDGLGGVNAHLLGTRLTSELKTDELGHLNLNLNPGEYVIQFEKSDQKISVNIFPEKITVLSIPLRAGPRPKETNVEFSLQYENMGGNAKGEKSQGSSESKSEANGSHPAEVKTATPSTNDMKAKRGSVSMAVAEFQDSTGKGLGLELSEDLAQYLFDLGVGKVIGPDNVSLIVNGQSEQSLNVRVSQNIPKQFATNLAVLGQIRGEELELRHYPFVTEVRAKVSSLIQVLDTNTGRALAGFAETGTSGMWRVDADAKNPEVGGSRPGLLSSALDDLAKRISDHF